MGLGSAESGLVNEAEEGKSVEPTEKAMEEVVVFTLRLVLVYERKWACPT